MGQSQYTFRLGTTVRCQVYYSTTRRPSEVMKQLTLRKMHSPASLSIGHLKFEAEAIIYNPPLLYVFVEGYLGG